EETVWRPSEYSGEPGTWAGPSTGFLQFALRCMTGTRRLSVGEPTRFYPKRREESIHPARNPSLNSGATWL
ncbi:MAG: hypothetical protein ACRDG3_04015, partial [Tepidiformaceae bacterium]